MRVSSRTFAPAAAIWLATHAAFADLGADAARLASAWKAQGVVHRLKPRLAERGIPTVIFLPAELSETTSGVCSSIAILAPTSTHFTVRAVGEAPGPPTPDDWPETSLAGLVQLSRCGARRARFSALLVEIRSPRAVIEVVAVTARVAVPSAVEVLPQRNPGPIAPLGGVRPRPEPLPLDARLKAAQARARREGGTDIVLSSLKSSPRGTGAHRQMLEVGCHRFNLLVEPTSDSEPFHDLAVVPEIDAAASLVRAEQGDGLDANVTVCAGDRSSFGIEFAGAPSSAPVRVVASRWPLPTGLPESWGATGRARVAAVLWKHGAVIRGGPVDQALGVQGPTLMPIAVEPGACYLGVLVAVRGTPHALALAAVSGSVSTQNHGGQGGEGTLVSFCARAQNAALFEADSRGTNLFWLFALFQNGRVAVGSEAP